MINNLTLRKIEKLNEDEKVKVLRSYFYYLYAKFNLLEHKDVKNALIFKKYIELDDINDVNEYIIISIKDIKNMLSYSEEEYEKILPIEENSNKSKKLVKDFDKI